MGCSKSISIDKAQRFAEWLGKKMYYHSERKYKCKMPVKRGEVYWVDLGENIGSEENKKRAVVVIQSNTTGFNSPVFIGAIITSSQKIRQDVHVLISGHYASTYKGKQYALHGAVDLGQIRTIAKERIVSNKVCVLKDEMIEIDDKLLNILGLRPKVSHLENKVNYLQGKIDYLSSLHDEVDDATLQI